MAGKTDDETFRWTGSEKEEFKFIEHQLGVADTKANIIITIDSVLIVITTLTALFQRDVEPSLRIISTLATALVLLSVGFCIRGIVDKMGYRFQGTFKAQEIS